MPAASYVSTPIERSLAFVKNTSSPNSVHGYMTNKFANVDHTAHAILSTSLDFIKYDKPSVKFDIKSKYHTLSSNDINANISSICSTYSKTKLSLNNVSSAVSNEKKSSSKDASSNSGKCLLPKPKEVLYSPNKIVLGWQGRVPVGAGLVNAINTCYLNSCLQALFHIPSFHHWLLNDTDHQHQCEKQGGSQFECLVCAMRKTLNHCQSKSGGAIRPELIIKKLKLIARHLEHHRQEDSHEFLTYLIDGMHKSYLKAIPGSNKLDSYSKETTPLYQLFGSYLRTEVTCNVCSHVSTSYTHGTELSLDIRQASSLDEALAHFFAKESLSGDNLYRCEPCGRSVEATKRFRLESPPNVLRLQLKRFNYHGFKNSRSVLVPILLDFGKYMHPPHLSLRPSSSGLKYKLVSAVIHHGSSPDSGHYTCIGSTSSGTYHYFDDEMVRASNLHQLTNAYVVMYELLPSSAASLHSSSSPGTPGMASTSASSPRKMIGPLLPPHVQPTGPAPSKSAPPPTIISSAVHSTVDISTITHNSHNGGKSNGNFTNGSKFVNGSYAAAGPTSKLVNGSSSPSPTKAVNGKTYSGAASAASSKLLNGVSKGPAVTPSKLPSPAFLKNGHGDARKPNNGVTADSNGDARRSMPDLSCANTNGNGTPPVKPAPVANGFSKPAAGGESRWNGRDEKKGGSGGAVSSAARSASPVRADKAAGATNGRDSPSSNKNGLKRAKLVDYESDEELESAPGDVMDRRGGGKRPRAAPDARNGWKVLGTSSEKEEGSPSVGTRGEEVRVAAGMQWSVVPVTPPANKTTPATTTPSFDAIALVAGTSFPSTPSPSPSLTPSPSPSSSVAPSSPSSVASSGGGRGGSGSNSSSHYFVSSLSAAGTGGSSRQNGAGTTSGGGGVSEYLSRRNMSGDSSYGSNNVTSWSNEPSTLVQTAGVQPQSRFPRHNAGGDREEDEEEMDRGRVKKVKSQQHNNSKYPNNGYYNKPGHNPFTHYQQHHNNNNNRKSYYNNSNNNNNNNNGGHDKYHYNKYPHYNNKSRQYRHQPYHHRRY